MTQREPDYRDVSPQNLRMVLRAILDLPSDTPTPEAPWPDGPARVLLDTEAWLVWMEAGLHAFTLAIEDGLDDPADDRRPPVPPLRTVVGAARWVAVVVAMLRCDGNLSHAACALQVSRRALREYLRAAGIYPWVPPAAETPRAETSTADDDPDDGGQR